MTKRRGTGFSSVSISWMFPNLLTISGLISGLTGLRFAMEGQFNFAIIMITLAALFDGLDGRMARMLKAESAFGAALDSLTDAIVFGIVPALVLYLWALEDAGRIAWASTLFYAVCIVLRLARFDSELPDKPDYAKGFFVGIPAPAAAFLVLTPVVLELQFDAPFLRDAEFVAATLILIGAGAVSILPTPNVKKLKVPVHMVLPVLAMVALLGGALVIQPWLVYITMAGLYILALPFALVSYLMKRRKANS